MQTNNNPLFVREHILTDSGINGSIFKRYFTVFNLGKKEAEINISVTATDDLSEPLQNWCSLRPNPVVLSPGDSQEVLLIFNIPQQATPEIYKYEVLFEAPEQYPEYFFRCVQQLAVSHIEKEPEWGEPPRFNLAPPSNSIEPYFIKPEGETTIMVTIKNQSLLVDSFELSCPDLESRWYTVRYPERDLKLPGLITETDGLKLNPGKEGQVALVIHPPSLTLAGSYVRTVKVTSSNRKDLILLDVLYLNIVADDRLDSNIFPQIQTLPKETGKFDLEINNLGNIVRNLDLRVESERGVFAYKLDTKEVSLPPGKIENFSLHVKPRWFMGWRRPLWGDGLRTKFELVADNTYNIALPETSKPPSIPKNLARGTVILAPRPRWQLITLIVFSILAAGGLIYGIWWWIFRLPPAPRIRAFNATKTTNNRETVLLNWEINNPQQVSKLGIITQKSNGEKDETYTNFQSCTKDNLQDCIPREFLRFCSVNDVRLECNEIPFKLADSDKYTLELQTFPRDARKLFRERDSNQVFDRISSDSIIIEPPPIPQISRNLGLVSSKNVYFKPSKESVELSWEVARYSKLGKLDIISRNSDGRERVYSYIYSDKTGNLEPLNAEARTDKLTCSRSERDIKACDWSIGVDGLEIGDRDYIIEVFADANAEEPVDTIETKNTVSIEPQTLSAIEQFTLNKNNIERDELFTVTWQIRNLQQIDTIEIKALSQDGSSTLLEQYEYPEEIASFCRVPQESEQLRCSILLANSLPPGNYTLQMRIEPKIEEAEIVTAQTDTLVVVEKPQPFEIEFFTINGETVESGKTYLYPRQNERPVKVDLGWSIAGKPEDIRVELLPIGQQENLTDSTSYYLQSDRETITLQVTNKLGEQKTKNLQIQSYESNSSRQFSQSRSPRSTSAPTLTPRSASSDLPSSESDSTLPPPPSNEIDPSRSRSIKLKPIEIAPKAN